ncbi:ABC transporter permease [Virgibacillus sp. MG-45]|uniref:ABC transporter permease n=1 Tax=Virgibacillus sp. MG-45 TaxID=3102791 RepID=UPI002EDA62F6
MRLSALIKRIVRQIIRDKRSIALMFIAPVFVITLLWLVLDLEDYEPTIAIYDIPNQLDTALNHQTATIITMSEKEALDALEEQAVDAFATVQGGTLYLKMEGSDPTANGAVQHVFNQAMKEHNPSQAQMEVEFLYGSKNLNLFDHVGAVLIGFFVFFFTFIIGGVSFLRERTQGTLERLLATPLKRWEIVAGYLIGFGIFILIQSVIVAAYAIYVLDIYMVGSFLEVLFITILLAIAALSMGTLLSAYAKNEFQMIQFIPIVIVPQVFFAGVFPISGIPWLEVIGKLMPLYYGADALTAIMIRGEHLTNVVLDITVLIGFSLLCISLNIVALKRYRSL